jgi:hypothetical protein
MPATRKKPAPPPISDDDPDVFWGVDELIRRGIVTGWGDLWSKQTRYGFPRGLILAGKRRSFSAVEVREWLAQRRDTDAAPRRRRNSPK